MRFASFAVTLALGCIAVVGCAKDAESVECATGIFCPAGTQCAAVQAVCLTTNCGNGKLDPGEQCDDGNIVDGDGCSSTCKTEGCGNGVIDPGEDCDPPGSSTGAVVCSATCKFEVCGNGVIDHDTNPVEQCDDGSNNTDTACATPSYSNPPMTCSTCTSKCQINTVVGPFCGDGKCSDGETQSSCPADCTGCGNGVLEGVEQCDNGQANTDTPCPTPPYNTAMPNQPNTCSTCTTSCTIDTVVGPFCGDGRCSNGETGTTCPADCMGCGNGIVEGAEQCDDGTMNTDTPCSVPYANPPMTCSTCTTSCQIDTVIGHHCGDGLCSDGETKVTCPADCAGCGNGILDAGEQCDDGVMNTNMPCSPPAYDTTTPDKPNTCSTCTKSCTIDTVLGPYCGDGTCQAADGETLTTCPADCTGCGNGIKEGSEECDNGTSNTDMQCPAPAYANPPNTCSTCTTKCLINTVVGPHCGDGKCDPTETKTNCPADCSGCGNGIKEGTEACDNGTSNTDSPCAPPAYANPPNTCSTCSTSCAIVTVIGPHCGDGACNNGETVTSCPQDCGTCGDGSLDGTEQCDTSATPNGLPASCNAYNSQFVSGSVACKNCQYDLSGCKASTCGNKVVDTNEDCDASDTTETLPSCTTVSSQFVSGSVTCSATCHYDLTGCKASNCGNGVLDTNEACDQSVAGETLPACTSFGYESGPGAVTCTNCQLVTTGCPSCNDGSKDGTETDLDCGGGACPGCGANKDCSANTDCAGGLTCKSGKCIAISASCTDGVKNEDETDIDCGGSICTARCPDGEDCLANTDCGATSFCDTTNGSICRPNTCTDGTTDGTETDQDCGGGACLACASGKMCLVNSDCSSGTCKGNKTCM